MVCFHILAVWHRLDPHSVSHAEVFVLARTASASSEVCFENFVCPHPSISHIMFSICRQETVLWHSQVHQGPGVCQQRPDSERTSGIKKCQKWFRFNRTQGRKAYLRRQQHGWERVSCYFLLHRGKHQVSSPMLSKCELACKDTCTNVTSFHINNYISLRKVTQFEFMHGLQGAIGQCLVHLATRPTEQYMSPPSNSGVMCKTCRFR